MKTEKILLTDYPTYNKVVKGCKDHKCSWCGRKIYKGDRHTFYNGSANSGNWWE